MLLYFSFDFSTFFHHHIKQKLVEKTRYTLMFHVELSSKKKANTEFIHGEQKKRKTI